MPKAKTRLEHVRRINLLTQAEVAEKIGMSAVNYSKLERGKRRLTVDTAMKLVELYGLKHIEELINSDIKVAI